ncbi:sulfatase-like hydrolase/transferase, partial [Planctomycetota bacterium]
TSWKPVWGRFSTIRDHHGELTLSLMADGTPVQLLCRAFDTGVGFRFVMSEESKGKDTAFFSACNVVGEVQYYSPEGEKGVNGPVSLNEMENIQVPLMIEHPDGRSLALMESDLYSATGFGAMEIHSDAETNGPVSSSTAVSTGGGHVTAWRVLLIGDTMGDFLENTVVLNLAAPCQLDDVSWIKPGKGIWDWRIRGYRNGQFRYNLNEQTLNHLIDFVAEQGFEWLNIDAGWSKRKANLEGVFAHAKAKGIKLMLYYDVRNSVFIEKEKLFEHYAGLDAAGIKHGIIRNDAALMRYAIKEAAENKLLINFHDRPCPMAGAERTMPNLITYEYCHAQQDGRKAFTPETFIKMAMVNALVAPLDQANGNFGIKSINAGERSLGPRTRNSYISTVVSETARTLVSYSGLVFLPDAPEEYLKKADLFEYLKAMPATWDDTHVLQSKIGDYISIARRTGDDWFVGTVNNQEARTLELSLDFLKPGTPYEATLYQDAADAHGLDNPEVYTITTATVKRSDVISAKMAVGGGHAMTLRPVKPVVEQAATPNIVLVIADDMAWADVGYNGQKDFETPHIDRLAADGMRFNHAYSGASVCSPSRACLISGMYSPRHNIYHPGNRARGKLECMKLAVPNRVVRNETYDWFAAIGDLDPGVNSLAKVLKPAGYVSARYGKWHVGRNEQGFDISRDVRNGYRIKDGTEQLTDGGIEFMRENKDRPFFLFVSYYDVHKPLVADPAVVKKYQAKKEQSGRDFNPVYAAMMEAVDTGVGRLRAELRTLGLEDNTLFIFNSDNGGYPDATSNLPLYGYKGTLYEGGIRIPTCMAWPSKIQPGSSCDTPVTFVDYLPTFAELVGTSLAQSKYPVDGVSMLPLMKGQAIDERPIFWHFPLYANVDHAVAPGTFPVFGTDNLYWRGVPATVIRRGNYKLLYYYEDQSVKLFDVVNDMGETQDLSAKQPEIAAQLLAELKAWTAAVDAPVPDRINPVFNPNN